MTLNPPRPLWAGRSLALAGILLVALNLRSAVANLSPIISEIRADIGLPVWVVGVLGMLPPVCFAIFGVFAPVLTRRFGLEVMVIVALAAITLGHLARGLAPSQLWLMLGSVLAFAGLGIGNVLLPPLVKKYFPDRIGLVTSIYVVLLSISTTLPAILAVPIADSSSWRVSLGMWAVFGVLALIPWVSLVVRHRTGTPADQPDEADAVVIGRLWRSPLAWAMAIVFGTSSLNAYAMFAWMPQMLHDIAGSTPTQAGALLSLYAIMGLPAGLLVPWLATRMGQRVGLLVYAGVAFFLIGDLGLLLIPGTATWLWVAFAGLGPLLFPLALVLINLRSRTHAGSVALSGFTQGVGYTFGALGPLLVGYLHEVSGGWTVPLIFLGVIALGAAFAGAVVARPHMIEDEQRS